MKPKNLTMILSLLVMVALAAAIPATSLAKTREPTGIVSLSLPQKQALTVQTIPVVYNAAAQLAAPASTYANITDVTVASDASAYEITINVDTDGDASLFQYSIDGGETWEIGKNTFKVTKDGIYTVQVISDRGDTLTYSSDIAVTGISSDTPAYTMVSGVEVAPVSPSKTKTMEIKLDTDKEDTSAYQYRIKDGADWQSEPAFTIDRNGDYKIAVKVSASQVIQYNPLIVVSKVDHTPPTITDVNCDDSTWSQSKHVSVTAADNMALAASPYSLDGGVTWQKSPTFTVTRNGKYLLVVRDQAGNTEQAAITIKKIDSLPPSCGTAAVDNTTYAQSKEVMIRAADAPATAASGESGVTAYRVNEGPWTAYGTPYQVTAVGNYTYNVRDAAGNISPQGSFKADKIDTTIPLISNVTVEKKCGTPEQTAVKDGDQISVKFLAADPGGPSAPAGYLTSSGIDNSTVNVTINGQTFLASGPDAKGYYTCAQAVGRDFKGEENSRVKVTVNCMDKTGNAAEQYTKTSGITYYAPIQINDLAMVSNNQEGGERAAKNQDKIKATFITSHPVRIYKAHIAGQKAEFSSSDGMNWTAVQTVRKGLIPDYTDVPLRFHTSDAAGNPETVSTENETTTPKIRYYAPITLTDLVIETSNRKDKTKYAKDGDSISVTFTSNHKVSLADAAIADKTPGVTKTASKKGAAVQWKLAYKLKNGDLEDLSRVGFAATAEDAAGNTPVTIAEKEAKNKITYYAPITSTTKIASNYRNEGYLKNGDTVAVTGKTNHSVEIARANIAGRKTENSVHKNTQAISYTMPKRETRIKEGVIPFSYEIEDPAGNRFSIDKANDKEKSQVLYDRTGPSASVTPDNFAFTKEKITYTFTYEDANLDGKDTAILVKGGAGKESKGKAISKTKYQRVITLSTDGNYDLQGEVVDLAGNKCQKAAKARVTVDKNKPIIDTSGVDLYTPKVYKGGFTLDQCFKFMDDNLKGIQCVVTNKNGTYDWDGYQPFTVDGKQSVTMMATDMAGNTSDPVNYDFYIDSTKPKAKIKDSFTGEVMEPDKETAFTEKAELAISLEKLNIQGVTPPDQLRTLQVYDGQGHLAADLLSSQKAKNGVYRQKLSKLGAYTIKVQAVDAVGNNTGLLTYPFSIREKTIFQTFFEHTPLVIVSFIVIPAMLAALILLLRKRKEEKEEEEEQNDKLRNLLERKGL